MPVFSYLAYPVPGAKAALQKDLSALACCEVLPADQEEILILITDTPDDETEKQLQQKFRSIKSLQSLGMTFGHVDN